MNSRNDRDLGSSTSAAGGRSTLGGPVRGRRQTRAIRLVNTLSAPNADARLAGSALNCGYGKRPLIVGAIDSVPAAALKVLCPAPHGGPVAKSAHAETRTGDPVER